MAKTDNSRKSNADHLKKYQWQKGKSGNPKGAPKRGESWAEIIKRIGEMTPGEAAARSLSLAKQLLEIGDGVTLKEAVILRVYGALIFEPQPGLLNAFMERTEGKVAQRVELDWKTEVSKRGVNPDELIDKLAAELFATVGAGAGISGGAREDQSGLDADTEREE